MFYSEPSGHLENWKSIVGTKKWKSKLKADWATEITMPLTKSERQGTGEHGEQGRKASATI